MSQSTIVKATCALCGSPEQKTLGTFQFRGQVLGLVKCRVCDLVYASPRLTEEAMQEYWRSYMAGLYREHWGRLQKEKLSGIIHDLRLLESYVSPRGRFLDVGFGNGLFMKYAVERGWQPIGVDVSSLACDLVSQKFGLPVFCGELEDISFAENFFDAVVCFDAFPYFADPLSTTTVLYKMAQMADNGGNTNPLEGQ